MQHILTAIDGSEPAERALKFAAELATKTGAKLSVLLVREFLVGRRDIHPILDEDEIRAVTGDAEHIIHEAGYSGAEYLTPKSRDAAYTIVDMAIEKAVDLIVMGASGKGAVKTAILGSVSQEVLRKAPCPVTIVH